MRYHTSTEALIQAAARKARDLGHSYVGSVHLLLALTLEAGDMGLVLRQLGVEPELTEALAQLLYGAGTPDLPLPQGLTEEARLLLRDAAREARQQKCREIQPKHLVLAMARRENCGAGELLRASGVSPETLFTHTVDYLQWER